MNAFICRSYRLVEVRSMIRRSSDDGSSWFTICLSGKTLSLYSYWPEECSWAESTKRPQIIRLSLAFSREGELIKDQSFIAGIRSTGLRANIEHAIRSCFSSLRSAAVSIVGRSRCDQKE